MNDLNKKAVGGLTGLIVCLALLLFIPAGTFHYWQAGVFLLVFFIGVLIITLYLMKKDPALLERRVHAGPVNEERTRQKIIQSFASLSFIALCTCIHRLFRGHPCLARAASHIFRLPGEHIHFGSY